MRGDTIIKHEEIVVGSFREMFNMIWKVFSLRHLGAGMIKDDPSLREQLIHLCPLINLRKSGKVEKGKVVGMVDLFWVMLHSKR